MRPPDALHSGSRMGSTKYIVGWSQNKCFSRGKTALMNKVMSQLIFFFFFFFFRNSLKKQNKSQQIFVGVVGLRQRNIFFMPCYSPVTILVSNFKVVSMSMKRLFPSCVKSRTPCSSFIVSQNSFYIQVLSNLHDFSSLNCGIHLEPTDLLNYIKKCMQYESVIGSFLIELRN